MYTCGIHWTSCFLLFFFKFLTKRTMECFKRKHRRHTHTYTYTFTHAHVHTHTNTTTSIGAVTVKLSEGRWVFN